MLAAFSCNIFLVPPYLTTSARYAIIFSATSGCAVIIFYHFSILFAIRKSPPERK
ncbi:hypothetical protein EUBSIR_01185 [[Eubacterium] siraeum DSM 15702]|uniref:Uncharacterized protein n=1 Tax=[Eubacterium] siraeum DSM 15702 TaxID=428128 RepID=B0MMX2_9FIRM|nr:hypothetical protein EUBSIR_01185 [[Eubacterium] siraeum DSM 15702]